MFRKSRVCRALVLSTLAMASLNAKAAVVSYTLDFDNINPPHVLNPNFGAIAMNGSGYAGFNWGAGWFATSDGVLDTYLSTSSNSLFITRATQGEAFRFDGFEYRSRGGDGDGRKFFYVLYGANGQAVYNSDDAKEDLNLRIAPQVLVSAYSDLVYGMAIGFINGGDNDGWKYLGVDDFKFGVDAAANVNTSIAGFNIASVPVPTALPLFLSGLSFLGFFRRQQK